MRTNFMPQRTGYSPPPFVRVNRSIAGGDYSLSETDLGVILNGPASICSLPSFTTYQLGKEYGIKNGSSNVQTIQAAPSEFILIGGQLVASITFNPELSRQLSRETTTQHWIIT